MYNQYVGPNRFQFLLESMSNLSENISKANKDNQLLVVRGPPATMLPALAKQWRITHLVFEEDDEKYAVVRDREVSQNMSDAKVQVLQKHGHTLWSHEHLMDLCKGRPPLSYGPFVKLTEQAGPPPKPLATPPSLPPQGDTDVAPLRRAEHPVDDFQQEDVNARFKPNEESIYDTIAGPNGTFSVPTFEELGLRPATTSHHGGESRALQVLDQWCQDKKEQILSFEKPKTSPAAFQPPETTTLSAHLKFGTLSPRRFWWAIKDIQKGSKKSHTAPPVSLDGQLLWREFFRVSPACCSRTRVLLAWLRNQLTCFCCESWPTTASKTSNRSEAIQCLAS